MRNTHWISISKISFFLFFCHYHDEEEGGSNIYKEWFKEKDNIKQKEKWYENVLSLFLLNYV